MEKNNKIGLLVLRNNGIQLLPKLLDRISVIDSLSVPFILQVKWKDEDVRKNVKNFYPKILDSNIIDKIIKLQGTAMIAIIIADNKPDPYRHTCGKCGRKVGAERLDNMNINRIKDDFRVQYGNIIHSADTERKALEEIILLGGAGALKEWNFSDIHYAKFDTVFSSDQIVEQLNIMEDGVKVWTPPEEL